MTRCNPVKWQTKRWRRMSPESCSKPKKTTWNFYRRCASGKYAFHCLFVCFRCSKYRLFLQKISICLVWFHHSIWWSLWKTSINRNPHILPTNQICIVSSLYYRYRYLKELRQHQTIFPTESLILIFSNIEKIFRFQQKFLDGLRYGIEHNKIADTFLEFVSFTFMCSLWADVFMVLYALHLKKLASINASNYIKCSFRTFKSKAVHFQLHPIHFILWEKCYDFLTCSFYFGFPFLGVFFFGGAAIGFYGLLNLL